MNQPFKLNLANRRAVQAIQVSYSGDVSHALGNLGLTPPKPVMVLVGGASGISPETMLRLKSLFVEVLAPLAELLGICVVDGGTDAGIMRLMGQARAEIHATFPLIGVAAVGTVILPNVRAVSAEAAPLEPHHTHFVLVPGKTWGEESPWIARVANALAQDEKSVTLLINGGKIAWLDVTNSVKAGRSVVIIAGSGRTADTLTAMVRSRKPDDNSASLTASGLLQPIDLEQGLEEIAHTLQNLLTAGSSGCISENQQASATMPLPKEG